MDIIDAIKERRSVRTFNGLPLSEAMIEKLNGDILDAASPFGGNVTIRLKQFDLKGPYKPGTYGMISSACDYFLIGAGSDEASALSTGYRFEHVVLKAWQAGLGTCWIGATFKGTDFERGQEWPDGEKLVIISPVGIAANQTFREKLVRTFAGSKNRKPFGTLFFNEDFGTPAEPGGLFGQALEMMRLAPSSTNSQPWRALVTGRTVHFYCVPASKYALIDCGIGLYHFEAGATLSGACGHFKKEKDAPAPHKDWRYIVSYLC